MINKKRYLAFGLLTLLIAATLFWCYGMKSSFDRFKEETGDNPIYIRKNAWFCFFVDSVKSEEVSFRIGKKIYNGSSFTDRWTDAMGPMTDHKFKIKTDSVTTREVFSGKQISGEFTKEFCDKENIDYDTLKKLSEESIQSGISFYTSLDFSDNAPMIIWDDYVFGLDEHNRIAIVCTRDGTPVELIGEDEFNTGSENFEKDNILNAPKYFFNDSFDKIYAFYKNENCVLLRVLQ